jgi:hypothetical protein
MWQSHCTRAWRPTARRACLGRSGRIDATATCNAQERWLGDGVYLVKPAQTELSVDELRVDVLVYFIRSEDLLNKDCLAWLRYLGGYQLFYLRRSRSRSRVILGRRRRTGTPVRTPTTSCCHRYIQLSRLAHKGRSSLADRRGGRTRTAAEGGSVESV